MGIERIHNKDPFWNYFLTLVEELKQISNFIEFDQANYSTYSSELSKVLMAASSEVDVVLKHVCGLLNPKKKHKNIDDYRKTITALIPDFSEEQVFIPLHGLRLTPWTNWSDNTSPDWWRAYNNVKHERSIYYSEASLKNALNAIGALYVCLFYLRAVRDFREEWDQQKDYALSSALGSFKPRSDFFKSSHLHNPLIFAD